MAVFVELTIPMECLEIGQATASLPESHIELEQIVPIDDGVIPYFWATVEDFDSFEASVGEYELVDRLEHVATVDNRRLYRVYWAETGKFVDALAASNATVLEGHGSDPWTFRLLFPTREQVTTFREQCAASKIPFDVRQVSELSDEVAEPQFGLTDQQHEALRLAVERGYYSIPRETTLADLAKEVGISQQAMSERLRRGTAKVLVNVIQPESQPPR